ncbi:hypothetical protein F2Q69_00017227 [Brassica cretica]|uniref:Uncharacterized protein n=2 Tax=Brassica TaxID=3705 RepID=A0A8S9QTU1_BRACR|nr:hypothetical protein F2Q69_00017227 [Brassica cretica]
MNMIFHGLGLQLICLINIQENGFGDHLNPLQSYLSTSLGKGHDLRIYSAYIKSDFHQRRWSGTEGTKASEDLDRKKLVVEEKMVVATMAITRTRFKLYGLERRRFGEFSEVTEESEFQNPAPVTKAINPSRRKVIMDMKMVDTKVVARDEEMVVDTVEVEDGRAMDTKVDTEVETVVTIDTVNEVAWLWM